MLLSLVLVALGAGDAAVAPEPAAVVDLSEVREHPSRWLGETVRFTLQIDGARSGVPTYLSSLGPSTHVAFAAWGDSQVLWSRAEYERPAQRLFARRGTPVAARLATASRYTRFEVVGVVREVLQGKPWIEVHEARRLERAVSEGALVHATRALSLMEGEQWALAADQFARARAGLLPRAALAELERLQTECAERSDASQRERKLR